MPRFLTGDELGNIKSLRYAENNLELKTIYDGSNIGKAKGVQALSIVSTTSGARLVRNIFHTRYNGVQNFVQGKIAAAHADGCVSVYTLQDDDQLEPVDQCKETRFKTDHRCVGLSVSDRYFILFPASQPSLSQFIGRGIYSCTSNGALRMTTLGAD